MKNLGYFQLKASPGVWQIKLAQGKSSELYSVRQRGKCSRQNLKKKNNNKTNNRLHVDLETNLQDDSQKKKTVEDIFDLCKI